MDVERVHLPEVRRKRTRKRSWGLAAVIPLVALVASCLYAIAAPSTPAFAAANAVIPTSPSPGTSTATINNYQQVTFPANDDGVWPCGGGNASVPCPGPDGETGPTTYPIGFNINFFGTNYDSAYINNNGNITFGAPLATYTPTDLTSFDNPIVAPFSADVDTRGASSALVNFGTGTLNGQKVFVVNWPGVGCYNQNSSVLDNFQLILIDRADRGTGPLGDDFDMEFNFNSIQWDTGQASGGDGNCQNGPAGNTAFVGYSNGTTTPGDSFTLPGSGVPQSFLDSSSSTGLIYNDLNSTTLGRYLFTVNAGQPTAPTTLSTSLSGGGETGTSISVPSGTAVSDSATLSGANAGTAGGTVTYNVYSDSSCTSLVNGGSAQPITTPGSLPSSNPVTLSTAGTYYWQAVYSGDGTNDGSVSPCSPGAVNEVETVTGGSTGPGTDLAVTLTNAVSTVKAGRSMTYCLTATDNGPLTATGITVTLTLPSGVTVTNPEGGTVSSEHRHLVRPVAQDRQAFQLQGDRPGHGDVGQRSDGNGDGGGCTT